MDASTQQSSYNRPYKSPFFIISLIFGILSLLSVCVVFPSLFFGSLSILFATLSHRKGRHWDNSAIGGIICSSIGMVLSLCMLITTLMAMPIMLKDEAYREQLNTASEMMYGKSFDEMLEESGMDKLFGEE